MGWKVQKPSTRILRNIGKLHGLHPQDRANVCLKSSETLDLTRNHKFPKQPTAAWDSDRQAFISVGSGGLLCKEAWLPTEAFPRDNMRSYSGLAEPSQPFFAVQILCRKVRSSMNQQINHVLKDKQNLADFTPYLGDGPPLSNETFASLNMLECAKKSNNSTVQASGTQICNICIVVHLPALWDLNSSHGKPTLLSWEDSLNNQGPHEA